MQQSPAIAQTSPKTRVVGPHCVARFDYLSDEAGDLRFNSGDVIKLVEHVADDWLKGEVDGRSGIFPVTFVEIVEDLPKPDVGTRQPERGE